MCCREIGCQQMHVESEIIENSITIQRKEKKEKSLLKSFVVLKFISLPTCKSFELQCCST